MLCTLELLLGGGFCRVIRFTLLKIIGIIIVPTFNSCTKYVGCPSKIRPIAIPFLEHGCIGDLTTEHSFDSKATGCGSFMRLVHFLTCCPWV